MAVGSEIRKGKARKPARLLSDFNMSGFTVKSKSPSMSSGF